MAPGTSARPALLPHFSSSQSINSASASSAIKPGPQSRCNLVNLGRAVFFLMTGILGTGTDVWFIISIAHVSKVTHLIKILLVLFVLVPPLSYYIVGTLYFANSQDGNDMQLRVPYFLCSVAFKKRFHMDYWPVRVLCLLVDTLLITSRLPFLVIACLPQHTFNDDLKDFVRRFAGVESFLQSLPMIVLQVIATIQMQEISIAFVVSVTGSALCSLFAICRASNEVCRFNCLS